MKIIKSTVEAAVQHTHRECGIQSGSVWLLCFRYIRCKVLHTLFPLLHTKNINNLYGFWFAILFPRLQLRFGQDFHKFLPNTLPCQALGGLQSIKHFQSSWFLIHSGKPWRLKEMNTQRYSIHLLLAVLTSLFKQLLLSALGSWKRQVGISQPEYLSHTSKRLLCVCV